MVERSGRETAILDAALELVTEVGYDRMSMDAVAARAKASKATIYRHWAGKGELVCDAMRCRAGADDVIPDTGSLRNDLLAVLSQMSEHIAGFDGQLALGLFIATDRDPELAGLVRQQLHEAKWSMWVRFCERASARGELGDPEAAAAVLAEVAPGMAFLRRFVLNLPLDEGWRTHTVDTVLLPLTTCTTPA